MYVRPEDIWLFPLTGAAIFLCAFGLIKRSRPMLALGFLGLVTSTYLIGEIYGSTRAFIHVVAFDVLTACVFILANMNK
jgi:hypothetical protein